MDLKDSGTRREFDSSAVRDCADGKGRCDLLPLWEVSQLMKSEVLSCLHTARVMDDEESIEDAILAFCNERGWDLSTATLEVAIHYEDGARKYDERNWEKGIPVHCYIDSAVRHYLKWRRGDEDEPHDRAVLWNLLGCLWTLHHRPECNDFFLGGNDDVE